MSSSPQMCSEHGLNNLAAKEIDFDAWQQIMACDARFCHVRPVLKDNAHLRHTYLRRRLELSREHSFFGTFSPDVKEDLSGKHCNDYKSIREQLLLLLYGCAFSGRLSSLPNSESFKVRSSNGSLRQSILSSSLTEVSHGKQCGKLSYTAAVEPKISSTLADDYAFCGIQHIFDHHTAAVNRLRFAHNDNTRLALASSDGTISICHTWPPGDSMRVLHVLTGGHSDSAAVTDTVWSLSNDFLVSAAMDGSVCMWDTQKAVLARVYPKESINIGPVLVCLFQPVNFNLLVLGGAWGSIQTLNLSTGKAIAKGRDQVHSTGFTRHHTLNTTAQFTCLGQGCVTALAFEDATGTCLWAGTDRGIIQSYHFQPNNGHLTRTKRLNLGISFPSHMLFDTTDIASGLHSVTRLPFKRAVQSYSSRKIGTFNALLRRGSSHRLKPSSGINLPLTAYSFPCITSLSVHSWLSNDAHDSYLLVSVVNFGLLLFRVLCTNNGKLVLEQTFPALHRPEANLPGRRFYPTSPMGLRAMHSCFAPLLSSYRSGACAMTGGLDCNVYVYNVLSRKAADLSNSTNGLITVLQGHAAPVLDVTVGWDESVLASADESGVVITWRRRSIDEST